ncbi:MAG: Cof-type HAD-IIB family hydrolase [Halanaerobium sp.]|nr:Cof-type HAD-IIB family hydrolase [Halanaerobium sp.]
MYRMLAVDLDDTLLQDDNTINQAVCQGIKSLDGNVEVVISTGRMFSSAVQYARELDLTGPVISYNGAMVRSAGDGQILEEHTLQPDLAREIMDFGRAKDIYTNIYIDDQLYYLGGREIADYYAGLSRVKASPLQEGLGDFRKPPTKLLFIDFSEDIIKELEDTLQSMYGGEAVITRSKPIFLEVVPPGISKRTALANLCKKRGISPSEVVAVGDSPNDKEMLQWAGMGVAMANAYDEIKDIADFITRKDNNQGGVREVIDKFFQRQE